MKQRTRLMNGGDDLINYNLTKKTDGDISGEIPLHKMRPQEHFIEAQVQEGDTLQAIALRFYCSISELKRINHIHKDNEIFARRIIKVPVTPYSVLTELMPSSQQNPVPSTSTYTLTSATPVAQEPVNNTHKAVQSSQNNNTEVKNDYAIDCNEVVLNSTLAPSLVPYTDVDPSEAMSEDTQLLPPKQREPVESVVVKELTSHGADFGLKWFHLVGCMLVLGVVIPLIYVMFYLDKTHEHDYPPLHTTR
ncbi:lysM and putative peptidoglycan-binding domain-containing protein 3 [Pectinophora gossypiella]|uniref:lysM and putative peptidoglycan-binding domain-containing protein 3 n=1 Tax=Pectinophora gossypiella TaxID=13191 RepID=UPI00214E9F4F|nr:lysM and putative peptidoglycan-binding domain-containing protein 3 [Pectinophora gossypiella]